MHEALQHLKEKGWTIRPSRAKSLRFPAALKKRYGNVPSEIAALLTGIAECVSPDERAWFLCQADYSGKNQSAFRWNQWELLSLDSADGDAELEAEISAFWDRHLPFYLSVRDGYCFAAMCLNGSNKGKVVEGREPDFEDVSIIAKSVIDFVYAL